MNIKNKKISKKEWWLKTIKHILETYILIEESDNYIELNRYVEYKGKYELLVDYIKSDLYEELSDHLTCVDGVGGKRDEQLGIMKFINFFSDLNLKVEDFWIGSAESTFGVNYIFNVMLVYKKNKYEYLSDFFSDFVNFEAEKILNEVLDYKNP